MGCTGTKDERASRDGCGKPMRWERAKEVKEGERKKRTRDGEDKKSNDV